jgi:hypothetical protein
MLPTGMVPGLLSPEQEAAVKQQAINNAALNFGLQALASSAGIGYKPTVGQIIGQAGQAGLQAYQGTFDQQLQNMLKQQQMADAQRKRQAEVARQEQLAKLAESAPEGQRELISLFPEQYAESMFREAKTAPGDVGAYEVALQRGFIPPDTTYEQFVAMRKPAPATTSVTNIVGGEKLSPGQIEQDKDFGKQINQWKMGGGQDMSAQIAQLKPVIEALESGKPITGVSVAIQPDILLAMTNPEALQSRELVEEVVQRNLRTILGSQFTAQEGERLIARAFNPKLRPEENAKRVRRLFLQMSTAAEQKQAMSDYFDQFGTLRGYTGKMPTVQDFYNAMEGGGTMSLPAGSNLQDAARRELDRRRGQ